MTRSKDKYPLYLNAFKKAIDRYVKELDGCELPDLTKVVFFGIKTANYKPEPTTYEESLADYQLCNTLKSMIAGYTPNELMSMFPVEKDFKGYKYEMKDYYSSMEYINTLDLNKPIGDNVLMLLGEYMNKDIHRFFVKSVISLNESRKYEGHIDMFEEFMAAQGMETPNTFKNTKGDAMYVLNGKPQSIGFKTNKLELVK